MIPGGFFKIWRKLLKSDLWLSEPFTKGQAWVDLVGLAMFSETKCRKRGIIFEIERGTAPCSEVELSSRWKWSRGKVRRFLNEMEVEQQIEQQKNNVTTLIKIVNYEDYQGDCTADSTPNRTPNGTPDEILPYINKKEKECIKYSEDSNEYRLAKFLLNHIKKNNPKHKDPNLQTWSKHIDYIIRIDNRDLEDIKSVIKWSQQHGFWKTNILSTEKLRKQFDKLWMQMQAETENNSKRPVPQTYAQCQDYERRNIASAVMDYLECENGKGNGAGDTCGPSYPESCALIPEHTGGDKGKG